VSHIGWKSGETFGVEILQEYECQSCGPWRLCTHRTSISPEDVGEIGKIGEFGDCGEGGENSMMLVQSREMICLSNSILNQILISNQVHTYRNSKQISPGSSGVFETDGTATLPHGKNRMK